MRLHKNNDGMTLIELIISMAITAIVLSMIVMIINVAAHSFRSTSENVNLQMEAQIAINQLSTLAMEASAITMEETTTERKYLFQSSPNCYAVVFVLAEKRLYLIQAATVDDAKSVIPDESLHLMSEYVMDIKIDSSDLKTAKINIAFQLGSEDYTINKRVKLRNAH